MIHLIGHTQNDLPVYVDLFKSGAAEHIARDPHLLALAAEALRYNTLEKTAVSLEQNMGRSIGYDFIVKTTTTDAIFYVQLARDELYTRFTKNGRALTTKYISMVLQRHPTDASYSVTDLWIGRLVPPRPGSTTETNQSKSYWSEHAFVFGNQPVQPRTLTKTCPY